MTQIGHIVIGLIVVSAAIYLIIFISQRLTTRKVNKLQQEKDDLQAIPMRDRIVEGRQLSLTGQSLQQFQILERKYEQLEDSGFDAIDEQATQVLYDVQGINFIKAAQSLRQLQQQVRDAKTTIDIVNQGLEDLKELDSAHKQAVKDLEQEYQELRKVLLSESFQFGPAIDQLEDVLSSLEDEFAEFSRLTERGDHAAAADIYETLGMETTQLEQRIDQIPALFKELDSTISDQLAELHTTYDRLNTEGYQFNQDVAEELQELDDEKQVALDALSELKLKKTSDKIDVLRTRIDALYQMFEDEMVAAKQVKQNNVALFEGLRQNKMLNHDLNIDLDRLSQDFVFTHDEDGQIRSWHMQLSRLDRELTELKTAIEQHEVVFSTILKPQQALHDELVQIEQGQRELWQEFGELPERKNQLNSRLVYLKNKMRQLQRRVERQGLAGLSEKYKADFYVVADELGRSEKQLMSSRTNIDDVERQLAIVSTDLDSLSETTEQMLEAAVVTERLVRKAQGHADNATVMAATQQARREYEENFDYTTAMHTLGDALETVESGVLDRTIKTYRQEQAALEEEFAERETYQK
ncbi:septation ring formation regulator [Weissella uvarum]|uniref:septation ring formation regulator EzrA n=1 Tax=Weissella uvarum TaxID=1479233 RepID=UPI0019606B71|nr:septation ring formation regulator EzrA [Weissella uvarum]MBM7617708.1 septation ring formation regulator [Weissella uvarum]MCM0596057.1 septation ring formation regulator EzrA [Weissella uvarum]